MSDSNEEKEYADYIAALRRDQLVISELVDELRIVNLARQDVNATLDRVDQYLEQGTEQGLESAIDEIQPFITSDV